MHLVSGMIFFARALTPFKVGVNAVNTLLFVPTTALCAIVIVSNDAVVCVLVILIFNPLCTCVIVSDVVLSQLQFPSLNIKCPIIFSKVVAVVCTHCSCLLFNP